MLLFISFNLLKAQSMCEQVDVGLVYSHSSDYESIGSPFYDGDISNDLRTQKITYTQVLNLLGTQIHFTQIKRSEKESICVYKFYFEASQIQISPQDVEDFEKFAMEKDGGTYIESDKDCVNGLKLLKFNNKTKEDIYNNRKNNWTFDC